MVPNSISHWIEEFSLTACLMILDHTRTLSKNGWLEGRDKNSNATIRQQLHTRAVWFEIFLSA